MIYCVPFFHGGCSMAFFFVFSSFSQFLFCGVCVREMCVKDIFRNKFLSTLPPSPLLMAPAPLTSTSRLSLGAVSGGTGSPWAPGLNTARRAQPLDLSLPNTRPSMTTPRRAGGASSLTTPRRAGGAPPYRGGGARATLSARGTLSSSAGALATPRRLPALAKAGSSGNLLFDQALKHAAEAKAGTVRAAPRCPLCARAWWVARVRIENSVQMC